MPRRTLFFLLLTLASLAPTIARSETTPTEATAIAAANNDHTAYTLSPDKLAKAEALYRVLAETGGAALVGPARELAPGTFYRPASE